MITHEDRERALRLLLAIPDSADRVITVAHALADERARALAPIRACPGLCAECSRDYALALADAHRGEAA